MAPGKFLKRVFTVFLAFMVSIGAFNLFVNPYDEFPWQFFLPGTPPVRTYKKEVIENTKPPIDYVVLGSSRLQSLDPENVFPGTNSINLITFNPFMEDIYAMWKYLLDKKGPPRGAILGLQVAFFHPGLYDDAVLFGDKDLGKYIDWTFYERVGYNWMRFRRLFRLYAVWHSTKVLINHAEGNSYYLAFDERGIAYVPGLRQSAGPLTKPSPDVMERRYKGRQARLIHIREIQYRNFTHLDKRRLEWLDEMLGDFEKYNVKAYIFTTPIHPDMFEISERMTPFDEWQTLMREMCKKHHAFFVNLTDASKIDWLPLWEFVDSGHLSEKAIKVLEVKLRDKYFNIGAGPPEEGGANKSGAEGDENGR